MDIVLIFLAVIFASMTGSATARAELVPERKDSYMTAGFITTLLMFACMIWLITRIT